MVSSEPPLPSRWRILLRGLQLRCPRCGRGGLFPGAFRIAERCPHCGLYLERGHGFYLGAVALNYGATLALWLLPVAVLGFFGVISLNGAVVLAAIGAIAFPVVFYRHSRTLWLAIYFAVLPHELRGNEKPED